MYLTPFQLTSHPAMCQPQNEVKCTSCNMYSRHSHMRQSARAILARGVLCTYQPPLVIIDILLSNLYACTHTHTHMHQHVAYLLPSILINCVSNHTHIHTARLEACKCFQLIIITTHECSTFFTELIPWVSWCYGSSHPPPPPPPLPPPLCTHLARSLLSPECSRVTPSPPSPLRVLCCLP